MINKINLHEFVSCVWNALFIYEHSNIERAFISHSGNLDAVIKNVCAFEYQNLFGFTVESKFSSKISCSESCLDNLIDFLLLSNDKYEFLRHFTVPYLTIRIGLVLRKCFEDEDLIGGASISKVGKVELCWMVSVWFLTW